MKITGLPALSDNYIWVIHSDNHNEAWIVDPGEAKPVLDYFQQQDLLLKGILVTHHHYDHVDGIPEIQQVFDQVPIIGNARGAYPYITQHVEDNDEINILGNCFKVLTTPGHCHDHISFYHPQALFCGDTLFSAGCGRSWTTSYQQFSNSLIKLREAVTSESCQMYCGHEYTWANINFAAIAEPNNPDITQRKEAVRALRRENKATLPISFHQETLTNPFLRFDLPELKAILTDKFDLQSPSEADLFSAVRNWKDALDVTGMLSQGL